MQTYTQSLYHIVFGTKRRERALTKRNRNIVFKYMSGILRNKDCPLYQINGVEDHVHILIHLHPSIALSDLVKDIKVASCLFIRRKKVLTYFNGWQNGYAAFTYTMESKKNLIKYIKEQEIHHKTNTLTQELNQLKRDHQDKAVFSL